MVDLGIGAESVPAPEHASAGMPAAVSHPLEEDCRVLEPVDFVLLRLKPLLESRNLAPARWVPHMAQHADFFPPRVQAHEGRVGAKQHVLKAFHRLDQMDFSARLLKGLADFLPLLSRAL